MVTWHRGVCIALAVGAASLGAVTAQRAHEAVVPKEDVLARIAPAEGGPSREVRLVFRPHGSAAGYADLVAVPASASEHAAAARVTVGPGFRHSALASLCSVLSGPPRQVLARVRHSRMSAVIVDFGTASPRVLYREDGLDGIAGKGRGRWFRLAESWSRSNFEGLDEMGVGVLGADGVVTRDLRWDGSDFVPVHGGLTRVVAGRRHAQ